MSKQKGKSSKKLILPEAVVREQAELKQLKSLDPTNLKEQIYTYKKQLNELIAEVNGLNIGISHNNDDYLKSTYELEERLRREQGLLNEMKSKHAAVTTECEVGMQELRRQWDSEKQEILGRKLREYNDSKEKLQDLTRKLENIQAFKEKEEEYRSQIARFKEKIEQAKESHKDELNKIKQDHVRIRMNIEEDSRSSIQQIRQVEHQHAQAKLGDREKHTKKENDILANHIELYRQEEQALNKEADRLQREIREQKSLLQELNVLNPTKENHERSLKIINLQDKINQLKTYLADESKRFDKELEDAVSTNEKQQKELEREIKRTRDATKKKDKEIHDLKMYSQMVLDQRGSLEWFLLEVANEHPEYFEDKISNLDSILRQLFMKVNSGVQPKNWRKQESQAVEVGSSAEIERESNND